VVAAALLGGPVPAGWGQEADQPVARVNGEPIMRAELDRALKRVPFPPDGTAAQRLALERNLLGLLIDELLLKQYLTRHVPPPDPALVRQRLAQLEAGLKAKNRTLADFCRETGQTEAQVRADLDLKLRLEAWSEQVAKNITEADLRAYYEANRELFDGVVIRVSHITLRVPPDADPAVHQQAAQTLQALKEQIAAGLDFADAARKYSQDPSAARGGDLGYFPPRRSDDDPFLRAASALAPGQVSEVVRTDYGYHLIMVTDRQPGRPTTFEEVKEVAREIYLDELKVRIIADERRQAKIELVK
jgi:peptidyl-prolyl cis-trans isomerase C